MAKGYIYILVNPGLKKDLLKIGRTTRDPEIRSNELSQGTGIPLPYYVAYSEQTVDCEAAESLIHENLSHLRAHESREFFALSVKDAIAEISKVCELLESTNNLLQTASNYLHQEQYEEAIPYLQQAANRGSAEAQYKLSSMYMEGLGGLDDGRLGFSYLEQSAKQGYVQAQDGLAILYAEGHGGERYAEKAIYWGQKAAENGSIEAARIVGNMLCCDHPGVVKDEKMALHWYRIAAEHGDPYAQYQLGASYEYGLGAKKNVDKAMFWYRKAKESGYKTAQERKLVSILHMPKKSQYLPSAYKKAIYEKKLGGICSSSYKYINVKDAEELLEEIPENKRPIFQHGFSINEDTEQTCMHPSCLYRGIIEFGDTVYCIEHYYAGLARGKD